MKFRHFDALMDEYAARVPLYDARIFYRGKEVYRRFHGFSDYEKTKPINGHEQYNLYSCSKFFTVAGALLLWEKGKFLLCDPVMKYLPAFAGVKVLDGDTLRRPARAMRMGDLFSMTAGLTYDYNTKNCLDAVRDTNGTCPTTVFPRYLAKDPLVFDPGQHYRYSLCHDMIAAVCEVIVGKRFADYMQEAVFDVLGMENSTYRADRVDYDRMAAQYIYNGETKQYESCGKELQYFAFGTEYDSGGAGCRSTSDDYIRFLEAIRTGTLLKESTVRKMHENRLCPNALRDMMLGADYGYGLGVRCEKAGSDVSDFGWDGAARSFAAVDIGHEYTLFLAQHALDCPTSEGRFRLPAAVRADIEEN